MKHLFLDLEDTVINPVVNGWHNTECINVDKVKAFIAQWKPDTVNIFSFAIWDDQQRFLFEQGTRQMLEETLSVKFNHVPTVEQIKLRCCAAQRINADKVEFSEMSDFWGKQLAFRLYIPHWLKRGGDVCLLDDAVRDEDWFTFDPPINAEIRNIITLDV